MRAPIRLAPALLVLPLLMPAAPAEAQMGTPGMVRPPQQQQSRPGLAPALPGLAARRAPAPIPGEPNAAMSPNEALFDSITRGDLAAARDAVSRGANLEARNALGLTPLDAAVDQGRNEIAFYLLSARDLNRAPAPPPTAGPGGLNSPPAEIVAGPTRREPTSSAARNAAATLAGAAASPAASSTNARLWAGDGGAPRPEIGFLGFDAGRPAGAEPPASAGRRGGRG